MIAYADDVALMFKGKLLSTVYEQGHLRVVTNWTVAKTEMVSFTRRCKIPMAPLRQMGDIHLQPADTVKYLGLILDGKLSRKPNIDKKAKKGSIAFYCRRRDIGKRWNVSPKVALRFYDRIVQPIMFYGVFMRVLNGFVEECLTLLPIASSVFVMRVIWVPKRSLRQLQS